MRIGILYSFSMSCWLPFTFPFKSPLLSVISALQIRQARRCALRKGKNTMAEWRHPFLLTWHLCRFSSNCARYYGKCTPFIVWSTVQTVLAEYIWNIWGHVYGSLLTSFSCCMLVRKRAFQQNCKNVHGVFHLDSHRWKVTISWLLRPQLQQLCTMTCTNCADGLR